MNNCITLLQFISALQSSASGINMQITHYDINYNTLEQLAIFKFLTDCYNYQTT